MREGSNFVDLAMPGSTDEASGIYQNELDARSTATSGADVLVQKRVHRKKDGRLGCGDTQRNIVGDTEDLGCIQETWRVPLVVHPRAQA